MSRVLRILLKKALRDLRQNAVSFSACAFMLVLAITIFVGFSSAFINLKHSCEATYHHLKFQDFSISLRRYTPLSAAERLRRIEGVAAVEPKIEVALRITLPGDQERTLAATAIGVPYDREPEVNRLNLDQGRYLQSARGEMLMERRFARMHGFKVGDQVYLELHDRSYRYRLVGLVSTPEYIWYVSSHADPRPSTRRWGILFLSRNDVEALQSRSGTREFQVRIQPESAGRREVIAADAKRRLAEYLPHTPTMREDQPSNSILLRDQRAFAGLAVLFPAVFFFLAACILFSTLWQLVSQQRRQVGILMVNGFDQRTIAGHYLFLTGSVGAAGLLGVPLGYLAGRLVTAFYAQTLGIPFVVMGLPLGAIVLSVVLTSVLCLGSGWLAVSRLLRLDPAGCLRSEVATTFRGGKHTLFSSLPYSLRFPLRNLSRQPIRTGVSILGVGFAVAQILMVLSLFDSQRSTLKFFFNEVHRYNLRIELYSREPEELPPLESWPGVLRVERSFRRAAVLSGPDGHIKKGLWGIEADSELFRLYDEQRGVIRLSEAEPLMLGSIAQRKIGVRRGQSAELMLTVGEEEAPVEEYTMGPAMLEVIDGPGVLPLRLLQKQNAAGGDPQTRAVNQLLVLVDPASLPDIRIRLREYSNVRSVISLPQMKQEIQELLSMLGAYRWIMFLFSASMAFALLTGTTTMNVLERKAELATLAVLGVRERTLAGLLLVEMIMLWFLGLLAGVPLGYILGNWLVNSYQSDLIQLHMSLGWGTLLLTAALSLVVCLLAALSSLNKVLSVPLKESMQHRP